MNIDLFVYIIHNNKHIYTLQTMTHKHIWNTKIPSQAKHTQIKLQMRLPNYMFNFLDILLLCIQII